MSVNIVKYISRNSNSQNATKSWSINASFLEVQVQHFEYELQK